MKTLYDLSLSPQRMSRAYYESLEQGGTVCGIPRVCAQSDHQPHDIGQGPFLIASPDQKWVQLPVKGARGRELENREEIHQMAVVSMGQEMGRQCRPFRGPSALLRSIIIPFNSPIVVQLAAPSAAQRALRMPGSSSQIASEDSHSK